MLYTRLSTILGALALLCTSAQAVIDSSPPTIEFAFAANIELDTPYYHVIDIPEGTRTTLGIKGGNLTDADGSVIAKILPDLGAENGYIGNDGIYRPDVRFAIEFVSDQKFGYVQLQGFGKVGGDCKIFSSIQTNSATYSHLNAQLFYGLLQFASDNLLYIPYWKPLSASEKPIVVQVDNPDFDSP